MRAIPATTLLVAVVTTISAGFVLSVMDAIAKHLAESLNVFIAAWARYTMHTIIMTLILYRRSRFRFLKTKRPGVQFARAACLFISTILMYTSITLVSLADATAIQFLSPVLVTVWSALFLGERIGIYRILAVAGGFMGVAIIVSPGLQLDQPALLLPLVVAFFASIYFILTRSLAGEDEQECTYFSTTAVGAVVLTLALPLFFEMPDPVEAALMVLIGATGALGHYLLIRAFSLAPASLLSPFLYSQVLAATLISVGWFGDPVSLTMAIGTAILIASGLYIWWRENRAALEAARLLQLGSRSEDHTGER